MGLKATNRLRKLKRNENKLKAWELFINGNSYEAIAREVGVTASTASKYIREEMELAYDRIQGHSDKFVAVESERLDVMTQALMRDLIKDVVVEDVDADGNVVKVKVKQVDKDIATTLLKVQERRAKYLSLDAPERKEVTTTLSLEGLVLQSQTRLQSISDDPQALKGDNLSKGGSLSEDIPTIADAEVIADEDTTTNE